MTADALLLGSSGQVGTALRQLLGRVTAPSHNELDLAMVSLDHARHLVETVRPSAIINCAAYTAVDGAEDEVETANKVNGTAVGILAEVAAHAGVPLVTFSTDYVFDGQGNQPYVESSSPDPVNAYGRSKLIGERLALEANPRALVIRTSWVISGTHSNFVATMLRLTREGRTLRVVNDQRGCPTIAIDLAKATLEALDRFDSGLLHVTNEGATTWFDLAKTAVTLAGLDHNLIEPCTTDEYPTRARRPAYSVLASERMGDLGMSALPPWQESLPSVVTQQMSR